MTSNNKTLIYRWWGISLIIAPLIFATATFFWQEGGHGLISAPLLVIASVFWIPAMMGLFDLLRKPMPYYAIIGLPIAIYACIGGAMFGAEGFFRIVYGISEAQAMQAYADYPFGFNVLLFLPGPLFPLSLFVLAIHLTRHKAVPRWTGILLALGAIVFPISRIPDIQLIAHAADLLLLVPTVYVGWRYLTRTGSTVALQTDHPIDQYVHQS